MDTKSFEEFPIEIAVMVSLWLDSPQIIWCTAYLFILHSFKILFIDTPLQILSNLDAEDLARFSCISKLSKAICDSPSVWKKVYQQRWIEQNEYEVEGDNWKQKYQDRGRQCTN
jgi:hypothetical protein